MVLLVWRTKKPPLRINTTGVLVRVKISSIDLICWFFFKFSNELLKLFHSIPRSHSVFLINVDFNIKKVKLELIFLKMIMLTTHSIWRNVNLTIKKSLLQILNITLSVSCRFTFKHHCTLLISQSTLSDSLFFHLGSGKDWNFGFKLVSTFLEGRDMKFWHKISLYRHIISHS